MVPRSWDDRSTLATHSYLRKDGVSIEHMVALANKVGGAHQGIRVPIRLLTQSVDTSHEFGNRGQHGTRILPGKFVTQFLVVPKSPPACVVALPVQINATPFFSLPLAANASDAYAAGMATAVAKQLDAGLQVYIEAGQGGPGWMTTDFVSRRNRGVGSDLGGLWAGF